MWIRALTGGAIGVAMASSCAHAKTLATMAPQAARTPAVAKTSAPDGLSGGGFYLEADTVTRNDLTHHIIAVGAVEARYKGRVLRADRVDYDTQTQRVIASGNVTIIDANGESQFAQSISLDKALTEGFATEFAARMTGDVKIAAESIERKNSHITVFHHVVYTPCQVCAETGSAHPTWSIQAKTVVEDSKSNRLQFSNATIKVLGEDVLYIPYLETASPSSARKTGFLLPLVTLTGPRGGTYEQPYYVAISPSQDILLSPQINTLVNPFLKVDWRKRFYSGQFEVRAGYGYDQDFTSGGDKFGPNTSRSYILADGEFQVSRNWKWGFTADRASDKLIFDKYAVTDVYTNGDHQDPGLYATDDRRLISQLYAVRQDENSYLSIAAISVQGLRATDQQRTIPIIAPLIEAHWQAPMAILGGRLRLDGSAVMLTPDQTLAPAANGTTSTLPGQDDRRATAQLDWQRHFTLSNGLVIDPFVNGRVDLFDITNIPATSNIAGGGPNATLARAFGSLGANVSYPLIRRTGPATIILEPMAQLSFAPYTKADRRIPNTDSVDFEFDETNLFQWNRSPGYDLYQGGQAATLAGRATVMMDSGQTASLLVGRRLAFQSDPATPAFTGLQPALSDWIFAADVSPYKGIQFFGRLRLDSRDFTLNRLETGASFKTARVEGYVSYLNEARSPSGPRVSSLDLHAAVYPLKHWGVTSYMIVDSGSWRRRELGAVYRDDCLRVEVIYRRDETFNGTLGPSTSVVLRLALATLGNSH